MDPDHTQRLVGPDLGLNCLQRLYADDTSRKRVDLNYSPLFFCPESAVCFLYLLHIFRLDFIPEANTMIPDQTAAFGAV